MSALGALIRRPLSDRTLAGFVVYRLRFALAALVGLFVASTAGYMTIEHFSLLDAAFMTVITLSTVGYGVVHPLDAIGRVFTMGVIVTSFVTLVFAGATLTTVYTSGEAADHRRQARGRRMRHALQDHVIVAGFGRVGQAAARGVRELDRDCVVMESDASLETRIGEAGHLAFIGDATDERDLVEAGIHRAAALIAAASDDATNLVVTLTARALCPDLRIISRVNQGDWQDRIMRAGANVAQSPYPSYGTSLAVSAITPGVLELHTLPLLGLATEEIEVSATSGLVGRLIPEIGEMTSGVLVIGLRRDQRFRRWDDVEGPIAPGDVIVALGEPTRVRALAQLV